MFNLFDKASRNSTPNARSATAAVYKKSIDGSIVLAVSAIPSMNDACITARNLSMKDSKNTYLVKNLVATTIDKRFGNYYAAFRNGTRVQF